MSIIHSKKINDVVVASFDQSISKFNALITEETKQALTGLFEKSGTKLVLDLTGIKYVDSSGFGVRHETPWTENSTESSHFTHHVGSCNQNVKVKPSLLDFLN